MQIPTQEITAFSPAPEFADRGFSIIPGVFTQQEIEAILQLIDAAPSGKPVFRKNEDLFAIRRFFREVPGVASLVFTHRLKAIIDAILSGCFVVKSIYFDKPPTSNWWVASHQDLTIAVDRRADFPGFDHWTTKQDQFSVQPPVAILENIFTVRIHLDDTNKENGALRVIPGSHRKGIVRPHANQEGLPECTCEVPRGGIMLMKPLLLHSSGRTTNRRSRRVIHIELSNHELPGGLVWAERLHID